MVSCDTAPCDVVPRDAVPCAHDVLLHGAVPWLASSFDQSHPARDAHDTFFIKDPGSALVSSSSIFYNIFCFVIFHRPLPGKRVLVCLLSPQGVIDGYLL